jgi:ATP-dependent Clp protease ATP-binding subunit ClpA
MAEEPRDIFSQKLTELFVAARDLANKYSHQYITSETLLAICLTDPEVEEIIRGVGGDFDEIKKTTAEYIANDIPTGYAAVDVNGDRSPELTVVATQTLQTTVAFGKASGKKELKPRDLFFRILDNENSEAAFIILNNGVDTLAVKEYISHSLASDDEEHEGEMTEPAFGPGPSKPKGKMTAKKAWSILEEFTVDLNQQAEKGRIDPLIGRELEVDKVIQILARRRKNNPILVGEPGVGKTAIAEGLAKTINDAEKARAEGESFTLPDLLLDTKILLLDMAQLVAGTKFRGEFEERLKDVVKATEFLIVEEQKKVILFIDEIQTMVGAGATSGSSMDAGNMLKPALSKGIIRVIGATTFAEYSKYFEKDRALNRRFNKVDVYEPSEEDTLRILQGLKSHYETFHGVSFTEEALRCAISMTVKYVHTNFLPDKAIDIIDAAGASQRVLPADVRKTVIDVHEIEVAVGRAARIPEEEVTKSDRDRLRNLHADLSAVVFGQELAITALEDAILLARAGLRPANKTAGAYLFSGPTGVGKTEVCRQIARILGYELIKFNMSEFMEKHTVSKLIGAPPGYVGFDDVAGGGSGMLVEEINKHPSCVLLLDEVEKAHPDVFNVLLQVMDEGKLTAQNGKAAMFRNVLLVMTTNAGSADAARKAIGFERGLNEGAEDAAIKKFFSPEFRNRLDGVIAFARLKPEHMEHIVRKFISELNVLVAEKNITIELTDEAYKWFAKEGYDEAYGARPLSRVIQNCISRPMSREMLFGALVNGGKALVSVNAENKIALVYA